jgi:acetyl esterase/lipase
MIEPIDSSEAEMNGRKLAAVLLGALAGSIGAGTWSSVGAAAPSGGQLVVCTVSEGEGPGLCTVPEPGPGDTLPTGYDSGIHPQVVGVPYGPDPLHVLDLYLPATTRPAPVIVFFHGGGWISGSREMVAQSLLREVRDGYAVASVDYRLAPAAQFPAPLEDAKRAVRWVKAHAAQFHVRRDKVFVAGSSAGGHLAAMVALTAGAFEPTGLPPDLAAQSSRVVGAFVEVGPLDLSALSEVAVPLGPDVVAQLLGCPQPSAEEPVPCSDAQKAAASPVAYVTPDDPPMYLGYGSLDLLVPPSTNAYELAHAYAQVGLGHRVAVDEVSHLGHNIDIEGVNVTRLGAFLDGVRADRRAFGTVSCGDARSAGEIGGGGVTMPERPGGCG